MNIDRPKKSSQRRKEKEELVKDSRPAPTKFNHTIQLTIKSPGKEESTTWPKSSHHITSQSVLSEHTGFNKYKTKSSINARWTNMGETAVSQERQ